MNLHIKNVCYGDVVRYDVNKHWEIYQWGEMMEITERSEREIYQFRRNGGNEQQMTGDISGR